MLVLRSVLQSVSAIEVLLAALQSIYHLGRSSITWVGRIATQVSLGGWFDCGNSRVVVFFRPCIGEIGTR
jgi:hypothetical protein